MDKDNIYEYSLYQFVVNKKLVQSKGMKKSFHEGFTTSLIVDFEFKYQGNPVSSTPKLANAYRCSPNTISNYYKAFKRLRDDDIIRDEHLEDRVNSPSEHEISTQVRLMESEQGKKALEQEVNELKKEQESEIARLKQDYQQEKDTLLQKNALLEEANKVSKQTEALFTKLLVANTKVKPVQLDLKPLSEKIASFEVKLELLDKLKVLDDIEVKLNLKDYNSQLRSELKQEIREEYAVKLDQALYTRHEMRQGIETIQGNISTFHKQYHDIEHTYATETFESIDKDMDWLQVRLTDMVNGLLVNM